MVHVVDMNGAVAQVCRHTKGSDMEKTSNIYCTPSITSITQIIKATVELIESEGK